MADNNENDRSLLKTSLALTPLGIGAGITARNIYEKGDYIPAGSSSMVDTASQFSPNLTPRIPTPSEVNQFMTRGRRSVIQDDLGLGFRRMSGEAWSPLVPKGQPIHGDVARQAWEWAMIGVDPSTREGLRTYTKGLEKMKQMDVLKAIGMTVTENQSRLMASVWERFKTNVGMLEEQMNLFGIVPGYRPVTATGVTRTYKGAVPEFFERSLQSMSETLGTPIGKWRGVTRGALGDEGFAMFHTTLRTNIGDVRLSVPGIQEVGEGRGGLLFEGGTLQTKRVAPEVAILDEATGQVERLSRSEFFLREVA
jgi:hypothetical protein